MSPFKLLMAASLVSSFALVGCGSSSEPSAAMKPPVSVIPGAKPAGQASHSPDEEGAVLSTTKVPPVDPAELEKEMAATPIRTVSAEELSGALKQLDDTEQSLQAVGLRFKEESAENGKPGLNWDYAFLDAKLEAGGTSFDAIKPLENFKKVAYNFIDRYDNEFIVNGNKITSHRLMHSQMPRLAAKIQIIEQTIADLQNRQKQNSKQKRSSRATRTQVA